MPRPTSTGAAAGPESGAAAIDAVLPQTQCGRCGYDGCRPYAEALARGETAINRCPPGGEATIAVLARLLGRPVLPPDPACGPMPARRVARIRIADCIGCTKCLRACPVDAIIGAPKHQHHVIESRCTGCDLCLPPCPTDCIEMIPIATDWNAADAARARRHHTARQARRSGTAPGAAPGAATEAASDAASEAVRRQDPLAMLAAPDEKARRLAAILARARSAPETSPR